MKNIAVIGGGAAGFFSAISVKTHYPNYNVALFEKSSKILSKVKISGGGRCNVTNSTIDVSVLIKAYPRGGKKLKNIFHQFGTVDTRNWFKNRGVPLKIESDGRVFPTSNSSQSIIDCLNTKIEISGPLLITHWGMSGPVILKASSFGARDLFEKKYIFELQVNWLFESNTEILFSTIEKYSLQHSKKLLSKQNPFKLPSRLWSFLITKFILSNDKKWGELGKKNMRKLIEFLTKDIYKVSGKTTFKEEFVTCGGISLESIDIKTMQSKTSKDLYFAGEVLNIDGITGGYNFQSAWSTGYIAGKLGN